MEPSVHHRIFGEIIPFVVSGHQMRTPAANLSDFSGTDFHSGIIQYFHLRQRQRDTH